jgi:hypothetical protein
MKLTWLAYVVSATESRIVRLPVLAAVQPIMRDCLLLYPRDALPIVVFPTAILEVRPESRDAPFAVCAATLYLQ